MTMKVKNIIEELDVKILSCSEQMEREVSSGYACDLLSWVMAHGSKNGLWITVQTHVNVVAIATLLEMTCVIIPESVTVDEKVVQKAEEEGIIILSSTMTAFEIAGRLYSM